MIISGTVDLLNGLSKLTGNSFTEAAYAAQKTIDYTHELTTGAISKAEYDDLIADLKVDDMVATTADEQNVKSMLSSLMSDLMTVLSAALPLA